MLEEKRTEATETHEEKEKSIISRRKLLASLGMAGAALAASTIMKGTDMKAFADPHDLYITPFQFGAKGDGVTDDTEAIQKTLIFAFKNKYSIKSPAISYAISKTIIIPQLFDNTFTKDRKITIDFGNADFVMLKDVTLFTSGYYDEYSVLKSNYGTPKMFKNTFQTVLENFTISSKVGYLKQPVLKIQDWHQGCEIRSIATHVCEVFLQSYNNFYTKFIGIDASYSGGGKVGVRFQFGGEHNLCAFQKLSAVNSDIGYQFNGLLTASIFKEMSVEGIRIGAQFNSEVDDLIIESCYNENIDDLCYEFNDYVFGVKFLGGYVNFVGSPNMYFLKYKPLPANNIQIDSSVVFKNIPDNSRIIKNKEDLYGIGISVELLSFVTGDLSQLNVKPNEFGSNIDVQSKRYFAGFIGNVNNKYIPGNYSGRYTAGMNGQHGFKWINLNNSTLQLETAIVNSQTQRIYVNLAINSGSPTITTLITGEFIGSFSSSKFYKHTDTGMVLSTDLSISVVDGLVQINGETIGNISNVVGEIRLI
ncbi:hypothetical protein [Paenibacillus sp. GCM10027626]|uniref:hypothetical protein n=1 Tax=Paenibacillus sp. GCM10027626 TaxID=3273411 RepID=UPI0036359ADA